MKDTDPYSPAWLESPELNNSRDEVNANKLEDIVEKVNYADEQRDHSY